jgi:GT2 family glycosyltransferase
MMMTDRGGAGRRSNRPPVSVVVPFLGDPAAARELVASLGRLRLGQDDELIAVDNGSGGALRDAAAGTAIRVVGAPLERSSYHARNVGAEQASGEWLAFTDADCVPDPSLIEEFLADPVDPEVGALAGTIRPARDRAGLLAEWAASREILSQERSLRGPGPPAGATANLLVRRAAWDRLGGFFEGLRSGGDFDFCWRLAEAGWRLEPRPAAAVEHVHRESLAGIVRQMARYAAGNAWQERRRPGSSPRPAVLRGLARSVAGVVGFALTLRFRRAALKAVDGVAIAAQALGRLRSNTAPGQESGDGAGKRIVLVERYPTDAEEVDGEAIVIARLRADRGPAGRRRVPVTYLEDVGPLARARAVAWLAARHPLRTLDQVRPRRSSASLRLPLSDLAVLARWSRVRGIPPGSGLFKAERS